MGIAAFTGLSGKLGLKDIFQPKFLKETSSVQVTESKALDLRGSVEAEMGVQWQDKQNDNSSKESKYKTTKKKKKGKLFDLVGVGYSLCLLSLYYWQKFWESVMQFRHQILNLCFHVYK